MDVPDLFSGQAQPYEHGEESTDEYLKKTTLSPWVPVPDTIARKALDMTGAGPDDIHVDLGSGDGRMNFHAIDTYLVKKSIGIGRIGRNQSNKVSNVPRCLFAFTSTQSPA